jgi:carboxyl-terminal processing protease
MKTWRLRTAAGAVATALALAACGGGGGGGGGNRGSSDGTVSASSTYAQRCAPGNPLAAASLRTGSLDIEKQWVRAYFDEDYLWRNEVPEVDRAAPAFSGSDVEAALDAYFEALKTPALTASGARKDRFSFTYPTAEWDALTRSGVQAGFGIEWLVLSRTVPRRVRIAYVEPGSPAANAGLARGDTLVSVDGISMDDTTPAGLAALNAALAPSGTGVATRFVFSRGGSTQPELTLTSASVVKTPVPERRVIVAAGGLRIGYLRFHDHLVTAEGALIEAVDHLRTQGIDELVLDIRYNGGGYLYIASELAHMLAGPTRTSGQVFERLLYNDRRPTPVVTPFYSTACLPDAGFRCTTSAALPTLGLPRVYVLTQPGTCSASESIVNGLRGVGVEVRQIGGTTCGKPYGFTAQDNCGVSYFPIEFQGVNAQGFGDYADGFVPAGTGTAGLPGCVVGDDLERPLGDANEAMLATAITHATTGACPPTSSTGREQAQGLQPAQGGQLVRPPVRENRFLAPMR